MESEGNCTRVPALHCKSIWNVVFLRSAATSDHYRCQSRCVQECRARLLSKEPACRLSGWCSPTRRLGLSTCARHHGPNNIGQARQALLGEPRDHGPGVTSWVWSQGKIVCEYYIIRPIFPNVHAVSGLVRTGAIRWPTINWKSYLSIHYYNEHPYI